MWGQARAGSGGSPPTWGHFRYQGSPVFSSLGWFQVGLPLHS